MFVLASVSVQMVDCTLQTRRKMQTEGKMQTAYNSFLYILCYFHYRVLTIKKKLFRLITACTPVC